MIQRPNVEPYLSRYLHSQAAKRGVPAAANFELTARCNFNCPMCYVHLNQEDQEAHGRELTAQQWIDLAQQAVDAGVIFVLLTGGEPFVRKDFFEIYHAMKRMGLMISINTNGSMLEGPIRQHLIDDPPFRVNISLYGGSNETYSGMCGQPAFDRVVENVRALKEAGIDVRLNVSVTPYNRHDQEAILRQAEKLGVHVKLSSYMYPAVRICEDACGYGNRLTPEEAARAAVDWDLYRFDQETFARRAEAIRSLKRVEQPECAAQLGEGISCRAGRSAFWVTWNGTMLPCGMMTGPVAYPLETGLQRAWETIRDASAQIRLPEKCSRCPKKELCPSCAATSVTETGRFDGVPEYLCTMTDEIIRLTTEEYLERGCLCEDQ